MRHKLALAGLFTAATQRLLAATPARAGRGATPPALLAGVIIIGLFLALVLGIVVVLALLGARERARRRGLVELARTQAATAGQEMPEWSAHSDQELLDNAELWAAMAHWYRECTDRELDPRPPMPADEALQVDDAHGDPKVGRPDAHGAA